MSRAADDERAVLLLGDPRLRVVSSEVAAFDSDLTTSCSALGATLEAFRKRHGFGRAISAPQVGIPRRIIAVNLGRGLFFIVNPRITAQSASTFTMWDDCMSFPDLLVRLARHESISIEYEDETGRPHDWIDLDPAASELLQHEIDHLDGILAVDRALDRDALLLKAQFESDRASYRSVVDYTIGEGLRTDG